MYIQMGCWKHATAFVEQSTTLLGYHCAFGGASRVTVPPRDSCNPLIRNVELGSRLNRFLDTDASVSRRPNVHVYNPRPLKLPTTRRRGDNGNKTGAEMAHARQTTQIIVLRQQIVRDRRRFTSEANARIADMGVDGYPFLLSFVRVIYFVPQFEGVILIQCFLFFIVERALVS